MPSSSRSCNAWWLGALLLAWATSSLVLLGETLLLVDRSLDGAADVVRFFACAGWLWFAWRCASKRLRTQARRAMAYGLILALPVQGIAAVEKQARGPAHFHADVAHSHGDVRHHHHAAGADAIAVDDGAAREVPPAAEEDKRVALDAVAPLPCASAPRRSAHAVQESAFAEPYLHVPAPDERPPRLS